MASDYEITLGDINEKTSTAASFYDFYSFICAFFRLQFKERTNIGFKEASGRDILAQL